MAAKSGDPSIGSRGRSGARSPRAHRVLRRTIGVPSFSANGRGDRFLLGLRVVPRSFPSVMLLMVNVTDFAFLSCAMGRRCGGCATGGRNLSMTLSRSPPVVVEVLIRPYVRASEALARSPRRDKDVREALRDWVRCRCPTFNDVGRREASRKNEWVNVVKPGGAGRSSRPVPRERGGRRPSSQTRRGFPEARIPPWLVPIYCSET
jgi:hypothetical protein